MVETVTSTLSLTKTITDAAAPFTTTAIPYFECNFHVYDADVKYGDGAVQDAICQAGGGFNYPKGDLRDMFFKNRTAGINGRVVIVATVPDFTVKEALKEY